ncbi:hypothetical protein [Lentibacillus sp. CBA3610]|uniref:hypothetical protein n=1 Tax=Lentibacillus sp. CBA3610 TaxID=2518176 RepID=UPI001595CAB0|nr:hypothetical protein [Lentibacillus sp. CBA3610]
MRVYHDRPSIEWSWDDKFAMSTEPLDADSLLAESNQEWDGLPEETIMGHIHLHSKSAKIQRNFIVDGLGVPNCNKYPGACSLSLYHHIWIKYGAVKCTPENSRRFLIGIACFFPDEQSQNGKIEKLESLGVSVKRKRVIRMS